MSFFQIHRLVIGRMVHLVFDTMRLAGLQEDYITSDCVQLCSCKKVTDRQPKVIKSYNEPAEGIVEVAGVPFFPL